MENNLDKYFKDNLHDRKFEMKEEYWLGAENLLNEQGDRRKRRVMFWWFGGLLGLLMLVGMAWWLLDKNGALKPIQSPANIALENTGTNGSNSPIRQEENGENSGAHQEEISITNEVEPSIKSNENKSVKSQFLTQKPAIDRDGKQNNSTPKTPDNQLVASKKTRSPLSSIGKPNNAQKGKNQAEILTKNGYSESKQVASKLGQQNQSEAEILSQNQQDAEQSLAPAQLDLLSCFVTGDFDKKQLEVNAETHTIVPEKSGKFHAGIMTSQSFQPQPSDGEKMRLSNQIGLVIRYDLNNGFYLASGLQYQRRGGHFEATKLAEQRSYRFGVELDTLLLRPKNLHYMTLPALIGWEKNHHMLELGLQLDFLTGVSGETGSYQKQGEPPVKAFVADKKGWMIKDGYRRFTPTLQVGYNYRITRLWSIGLSANYTLNGVIDASFDPPVGSFLLKESNKFYLNLKATYFFN